MPSMNMSTDTEAGFIPEIWSAETRDAVEAQLVMAKLVEDKFEGEISSKGDTVHVRDIQNLTAKDKAPQTDVEFEAPDDTGMTITIDTHKYAAFKVEDILKVQANVDLIQKYTKKAGYAIVEAIDSDLMDLATGVSHTVGTAGTNITDENLTRAIQYLDDANVPQTQRSLVLKPSQKRAILLLDKFMLTQDVGYNSGNSPIVTGKLANATDQAHWGDVYGVSVYVTTNVSTGGGSPTPTYNMLFHREAFAIARQMMPRVQSDYNIRSLATEVVADVLYGVAEYRDDFAVVIVT